jgi:DNA repair protein RecN (Recombination protein N)
MIQELHITNLAVISDTTLSFLSPYVALLGETGAGKSLVVDSLGLLKGDRSDFTLVRNPKEKASVSAVFSLSLDFLRKHPELREYVSEGGTLILRRVLFPDRTNRSYLNDEPVSLAEYRKAVSHLIDIHSQGGNSDLLDESRHLFYLDSFGKGKETDALCAYQKAYQAYQDAKSDLASLIASHQELDRDYLTFQIDEITKYHLKENEIEDLNAEYLSLRGYEKLREKMDAYEKETGYAEGNLPELLARAETRLRALEDTDLSEEAKASEEECRKLEENLHALSAKFRSLDFDPHRIDEINERLFELKGLERKYGNSTAAILSKLREYQGKIAESDSFEDRKADLASAVEEKKKEAAEKAAVLTALRKETAGKLSLSIGKEMADLGLPKDGFRVRITPREELGPDGAEAVGFDVALNAGLAFAPLAKAASGGENSRLMLSLKAVLNALDPYDLLVFDEVDTGVSGRVASLVAKKIKGLSEKSQIVVISHLPQVVASAEAAIAIEKTVHGNETFTTARSVKDEEITLEVAKMISGQNVTEAAKKQAEELIRECR